MITCYASRVQILMNAFFVLSYAFSNLSDLDYRVILKVSDFFLLFGKRRSIALSSNPVEDSLYLVKKKLFLFNPFNQSKVN